MVVPAPIEMTTKAKHREYTRKWRSDPDNREKTRAWSRVTSKRRLQDPLRRYEYNLRKYVWRAVFRYEGKRRSPVFEARLGCTQPEFRAHIEQQFEEGMSWANYGKWELDHIIPVSTATTKEGVLKLFHYSNYRPRWSWENVREH